MNDIAVCNKGLCELAKPANELRVLKGAVPQDLKSTAAYAVLSRVNKLVLKLQFQDVVVEGAENIPSNGPFLMVANHLSRYDGLLLYRFINRPTNFLVTPSELKGLQGIVLRSMGAFPANPKLKLIDYAKSLWQKEQGVVIFPEGAINRDELTHRFKAGAARFALAAGAEGLVLPIIPAAITYNDDIKQAKVVFAKPIDISDYVISYAENERAAINALTTRLHREVCYGRVGLGERKDHGTLFANENVCWLAPR